jgi:hypothetical protein
LKSKWKVKQRATLSRKKNLPKTANRRIRWKPSRQKES